MTTDAQDIGRGVGIAAARYRFVHNVDRSWTGLDARDVYQLKSEGVKPGTDAWGEAEQAAEIAYRTALFCWDHVPAQEATP